MKKSVNELSLRDFVSWFYFEYLKCGFWIDNSQCDTYLGNSTGMWLYLEDLESWVYVGHLKLFWGLLFIYLFIYYYYYFIYLYFGDFWSCYHSLGSKPIDVVLCRMVLDGSKIKKVLGRKCRLTPPFYVIKPESLKRQNWKKKKKRKNIYIYIGGNLILKKTLCWARIELGLRF